jgi:hypothetical protein
MNIDKLLALDKSQIKNERLVKILTEFIEDYNQIDEKDIDKFLENSKDEIASISNILERAYPGIFESASQLTNSPKKVKASTVKSPKNNSKTPTQKDTPKKEEQPKKKTTSKEKESVEKKAEASNDKDDDLAQLTKEIQKCRLRIREYNERKNAGKPEKPKPKRYEKIESKIISIWNLMPDHLKYNESVIEGAKNIISDFIQDIMKEYRMNQKQIDMVRKTILEKFKAQKEKINKDKD